MPTYLTFKKLLLTVGDLALLFSLVSSASSEATLSCNGSSTTSSTSGSNSERFSILRTHSWRASSAFRNGKYLTFLVLHSGLLHRFVHPKAQQEAWPGMMKTIRQKAHNYPRNDNLCICDSCHIKANFAPLSWRG